MRLSKFLLISAMVTCFSLLYVWQQTEAFRLAYVSQKNMAVFQELLDKNTILRYNIKRNTSLVRIGNKVFECADFQMPDTIQLVRARSPERIVSISQRAPKKQNLFSLLFGIKRQAEAKTINR